MKSVVCALVWLFATAAMADWYRGNTHAHTRRSPDGSNSPSKMARWYASHGYDFLVFTDHNRVTGPDNVRFPPSNFLIIPGEEITHGIYHRGNLKLVHTTGINLRHKIFMSLYQSPRWIVRDNISQIHDQGGLAQINHPNYYLSLSAEDLMAIDGATLFELYNGSGGAFNDGVGSYESVESMWDYLLTRGKTIYGVATDDAHQLEEGDGGDPSGWNLPATGWVSVNAPSLETDGIMQGLRTGNFYASTGIELEHVEYGEDHLAVTVKPKGGVYYWIRFIGPNGEVLQNSLGTDAVYHRGGDESYIRATITDSNYKRAWTQPVLFDLN